MISRAEIWKHSGIIKEKANTGRVRRTNQGEDQERERRETALVEAVLGRLRRGGGGLEADESYTKFSKSGGEASIISDHARSVWHTN